MARRRKRRLLTSDGDVAAPACAEPGGDAEPEEDEATGPLRRCAVTRERADPSGMIRFVIGPGDAVVPDLARKLPGRGIWLSARRDVVETARTKGAFARAARGKVVVPPDLAEMVETGLTRRIVELVGLARRAGQAVGGFVKAREMIGTGRCGLLVEAFDGSEEERARLISAAAIDVVTPLDAATLGAAFGRDHMVHVGVSPGRLAGSIATESARLAGMRGVGSNVRRAGA